MKNTDAVNIGALRVLVVAVSITLIVGSIISYDKFAAQMFGILGGVFLPLVALLYEVSG